jgi:5-methylcytosine-specific restriction endonuclease McrA
MSKVLTEEHKGKIRLGCKGINSKPKIEKVCICGKIFYVKPSYDRVKSHSFSCRNKLLLSKERLIELGKNGARSRWKGHIAMPRKTTVKKYGKYSIEKKRFTNQRYKARKRMAEGSHTFLEWQNLKIFYKFMCLSCKKYEPGIKLTEDHIIPLSMGGTDFIENIQPLCGSCNTRKNAKSISYLPPSDSLIYEERGMVN